MDAQTKKEKADCVNAVWKQVEKILEERGISQKDFVQKCKDKGYAITQPEVSKLKNGTAKITLYQVIAFADTLNVSLDYIVKGKNENGTVCFREGKLISSVRSGSFEGILGSYYTLFHSTSDEDKWLHGKLSLQPDDKGICRADYVLNTGEKNSEGEEINKYYTGQVVVSKDIPIMYIILFNKQMGEMCFLELRYRKFWVKGMKCRIALALTTSSGDDKVPNAHKMFLFQEPVNSDIISEVKEVLRWKENSFFISQDELKDLISQYPKFQKYFEELKKDEAKEYYRVQEVTGKKFGAMEKEKIYGFLKEITDAPYNMHLSKEEDNYAFRVMENMQKHE